jgi:DNA polymerase-3 subunit alpha
MGGVLAQRVLESGEDDARSALDKLTETFDPGSFYIELQDHGLVEQPVLNGILARLAAERNVPIVATNDAHFANREDGEGHLYLSCIAANRSYADAFEAHHQSFEMFLKSPDEMAHTFRDHPNAIKNTLEIAERCAGLKLVLGKPMLPTFALPEGYDTDSYFRHIAHEGLTRRFDEFRRVKISVDEASYRKRLDMELDIIIGMKFPGYFLIVWDFIRHAKENGIPVGRGADPVQDRSSRTHYASRTSTRFPTTCCSSDSSIRNASACPTSTSTFAWTGVTKSSGTLQTSTEKPALDRSRRFTS